MYIETMTIYLVDYENVSEKGLVGYQNVQEEDRVIVFYNAALNPKIPISVVQFLGSRMEFQEVPKSGKNYLDIYLSTYLGRITEQCPEANFVIVSRDKDYAPAMDCCRCAGVRVSQVQSLAQSFAG